MNRRSDAVDEHSHGRGHSHAHDHGHDAPSRHHGTADLSLARCGFCCRPDPFRSGPNLADDAFREDLDILCAFLRNAGESPHLIGHDRKAAPALSSPSRLNSCIQRQKIGLIGNVPDHAGDPADLNCLLLEERDDFDHRALA